MHEYVESVNTCDARGTTLMYESRSNFAYHRSSSFDALWRTFLAVVSTQLSTTTSEVTCENSDLLLFNSAAIERVLSSLLISDDRDSTQRRPITPEELHKRLPGINSPSLKSDGVYRLDNRYTPG
jgi:hypothetical protein